MKYIVRRVNKTDNLINSFDNKKVKITKTNKLIKSGYNDYKRTCK